MTDGSWLSAPKYNDNAHILTESHLYSKSRPHVYYFVLMDCFGQFSDNFVNRDLIPRLITTWSITHGEFEDNHFSLEDEGSLN